MQLRFLLADIALVMGTLQGWYYSGSPTELMWLFGYVCPSVCFIEHKTALASQRGESS